MADQTSGPARTEIDRRRLWIGTAVVIGTLVVLLLVGLLPHRARQRDLAVRAREAALDDSVPRVSVVRISRSTPAADLMLPGTLQGNHLTSIYARSSGYVQRWYADMGTRVHQGQVLATIEAPDVDEELAQAQQQAASARATLQLNEVNLARWKVLYRDSTVTKQELDTFQSAYDASVASVAGADANVRRLQALVGFQRITAPFDGVITARNVDNGVFVTAVGTTNTPQPAGTGGNTLINTVEATELFRLASTDTLRLYLGVPQSYAVAVRVGMPATLAVRDLPGRAFSGRVTRTANAVDAASLTLLTEVDVINSDRSLLPGMFAQAHLRFERSNPPLLMPGTAMIFRTSAPQAAVVGRDSIARFRTLEVGRDFGTVIEVDSGLVDGDYVVAQPNDALRDGQPVRARAAAETGAPGADTQAVRPVAPLRTPTGQPPAPQTGASGSPASPQGGATYKPPPQVETGFPAAPPPARP